MCSGSPRWRSHPGPAREHQREGPGPAAGRHRRRDPPPPPPARQGEGLVWAGTEHRDRDLRAPPLEGEESVDGRGVGRQSGQAVDGVGGQHHDAAADQCGGHVVEIGWSWAAQPDATEGRRTLSGTRRGLGRGRPGPARSRAPVRPAPRASARARGPWVSPISTTTVPSAASHRACLRDDVLDGLEARRPGHERPAGLPRRPPRPAAARRSATYGGLETTTSTRPSRSAGQGLEPVALDQAHHRRPGGRGRPGWPGPRRGRRRRRRWPTPRTSGHRSAASDRAMAPEPVPRSTPRPARPSPASGVDREAGHHLGLGPGDQHPSVDEEVEGAEPPAAEHVLQRLAGRAAGDHAVDAPCLAPGEHRIVEGGGLLGGRRGRWPARRSSGAPARGRRRRRRRSDSRLASRTWRQAGGHADSLSRRVCSSATSASITSSSSPASTLSSL